MKRWLVLLLVVALGASALAAPVHAGKKKKKAAACKAYVPGEMGAQAETTRITDKATEEEPIEIEVPFAPAAGASATQTHEYHNVQVDSKAKEAGLYARLESPPTDDPDLYVYWDNGNRAAVAGGFNQAPVGPLDGTGSGGHSEIGAEQIDGLRTKDCGGFTLDMVNWAGIGGTYTLKLWLGEIQNDPAPRDG